jgi:hypothetical protein
VDQLIARGEPLLLDTPRVGRVLVTRIAADDRGTGALEEAERSAPSRIE